MRGFYIVKNPLVKPTLSINEGFSTIEGFQCTWTDTKIDGVTLFLRKTVDRIIFCYLLNETNFVLFLRFDLLRASA